MYRLSPRALALAFGGLVFVTADAAAQLFTTNTVATLGPDAFGIAVGDFNGDGYLDLVTTDRTDRQIRLVRNQQNGTYAVQTLTTLPDAPWGIVAANFKTYGNSDFITANYFNSSVTVGRNTGVNYSLTTTSVGASAYLAYRPVAADLDGDGDLDVATANMDGNSVAVLLNDDGFGSSFTVSLFPVAGRPSSIAVGDLDGDGDLDLVTTNVDGGTVSILRNNGGGGFLVSTLPVGASPISVAVGDLDGDGDLDLAVADLGTQDPDTFQYFGGGVHILPNDGPGTFGSPSFVAIDYGPRSVVAGDLDGDGDLDLAAANLYDDIYMLTNSGAATFTAGYIGSVDPGVIDVVTGDLDNDGDLDLATISTNFVSVLTNTRTGTEPSTPTNAATVGAPTSITINYTAPADANYVLIVRTPPGETAPPPTDNREYRLGATYYDDSFTSSGTVVGIRAPGAGNSDTFTDTTPDPGVLYTYAIYGFTGTAPQPVGPQATTGISPDYGTGTFVTGITADAPLPVELSSFTGSGRSGAVSLNWTTATETDNAGFVVLRDGIEIASYRTLASLRGHGTTANRSAYAFADARVQPGRSYTYTLRSTDLNGTTHDYAQSVSVTVEAAAAVPTVFRLLGASPNPFNPSTTIRFDLPTAGTVQAKLFDALGRAVRTVGGQFPAGAAQSLTLDASGLPSGAYLVRLTAGASTQTVRVTLAK